MELESHVSLDRHCFGICFQVIDLGPTLHDNRGHWSGPDKKIFRSPESMFDHRFRTLTPLLILWQILLPLCAHHLHDCAEALCAEGSCVDNRRSERSEDSAAGLGHCRCDFRRASADSGEGSEEQLPEQEKHDCSRCSICQTIATPRILVTALEVTRSEHSIGLISVQDWSDPMLGFGLLPQCRAPPRL